METINFEERFIINLVPTAIGRSVIAWNNVTYSVFQLFETLSEMDRESAKAVFFIIKSDRSQRDMVTELVREKLKPEHAKLARRINAKYSDINSLAAKRNDILHVVYLDEQTFMKTKVFQDVGYLGGKVGNDLIDAIHKTTMDCLDMSIDLMKLNKEVLALKDYKNKSLAKALGEYIARHKSPMDPNAGVFGLLDNPAKT